MAQSRFTTARELVEAFPTARYYIETEPTDQPPVEFIETLVAAGAYRDAISCCAFLLPRREAVWWACQCVRAAGKPLTPLEKAALDAAEAWVKTPEEEYRQAALEISTKEQRDSAILWACRAAARSGGVIGTSAKGPVRARPDATAGAVRAAVLIATTALRRENQATGMKSFVDEALKLVQGDLGG